MHCTPNSTVILFRGGRLPSWHALAPAERTEFERVHVDLMLDIAERHGLERLEGFRLVGPQSSWERFWTIAFPSADGAAVWIKAEMAPPYGRYGFYEYNLARPLSVDVLEQWGAPPRAEVTPVDFDPHRIPSLAIAADSIVVFRFERWRPEATELAPDERGEKHCREQAREVAGQFGLRRLECFALTAPRADWHRAWIAEFPDVSGAEAWIDTFTSQPVGRYIEQKILLARKWAPEYFAAWSAH